MPDRRDARPTKPRQRKPVPNNQPVMPEVEDEVTRPAEPVRAPLRVVERLAPNKRHDPRREE